MASNNSSKVMVPEAREALNRFKMEAASEVGVNLKQGYNGDLTSREAGSVGGQMVKNIIPELQYEFTHINRCAMGHKMHINFLLNIIP
ncbi:MAG: alpha/beta-type small acid-soluble spore protein [Ruminococcaceae bacterium]|nr:alpha/beta-type small acid-soluble spore protein [Oscillospiraceae bacterium]